VQVTARLLAEKVGPHPVGPRDLLGEMALVAVARAPIGEDIEGTTPGVSGTYIDVSHLPYGAASPSAQRTKTRQSARSLAQDRGFKR